MASDTPRLQLRKLGPRKPRTRGGFHSVAGSSAGVPARVPPCCVPGPPHSLVPHYLAHHTLPARAHLPARPQAGTRQSCPRRRSPSGCGVQGLLGSCWKAGEGPGTGQSLGTEPECPTTHPEAALDCRDQTPCRRPSFLWRSCPYSPETPDEVREGRRPGTDTHPRRPHTVRLNLTGDRRPGVNLRHCFSPTGKVRF